MSYCGLKEFAFAEGYFHIGATGIVTFDDGTPEEIIKEFWVHWPSFREKVIERQERGVFTSTYPVLPFEDPIENRRNYER